MRKLTRIFMLVLIACPITKCAVTEEQARQNARMAVKERQHLESLPYATRDEAIEDDLAVYRDLLVQGKHIKGIFIYVVNEVGCEPYKESETGRSCTVVVDDDPRAYVAVSEATGETYLLSQFEEAEKEFNRMAKVERVEVKSGYEIGWANLYFKLCFGMGLYPRRTVVGSDFEVKQLAAAEFHEMFYEYEPHAKGKATGQRKDEILFRKWWNEYECSVKELPSPSSTWLNGAYSVHLKVFYGMNLTLNFADPPRKTPDIEDWALRVQTDGRVTKEKVTVLFPRHR